MKFEPGQLCIVNPDSPHAEEFHYTDIVGLKVTIGTGKPIHSPRSIHTHMRVYTLSGHGWIVVADDLLSKNSTNKSLRHILEQEG